MTRIIKFYLLLFAFYFCHFISFGQQSKIDSFLTLLKTDKADTNKQFHLNRLSWQYVKVGSYDSAMYYANYALQLSEVLLREATNQKIKQAINKHKAYSYNNIGSVYHSQSNYPEAFKNFLLSLKLREIVGDKNGEAASYNNIGSVYYYQDNYPEALKNFLLSLKIYKAMGDKDNIASCYNNIGNVYSDQGNYPEALKNFFASLKIWEEFDDQNRIAASYNNIGSVYYNQKNYPEALKNYLTSLKIREEIGDKSGIAASSVNVGAVFTKQKKYKEAEVYLITARDLSKEIGFKECLKNTYKTLTALDSAKRNFKGAYENHKLYILYRDSIDNEETRKKTIQSQMTFHFEKKEAVVNAEHKKELEIQQVLADEKSRKQKVITYSVSVGLFLVFLLALFIFRGYKQKQKANIIITEQKAEVERQKEITDEQKKIVEEKNKDITDSINYAKRIQEAILIPENEIKKQFSDAFVIFNPKDIVSGDFYWFAESKYNKLLAIADCTGHGVPGGFMSMLGFSMLQETLLLEEIKTTAEALTSLDKKITETLNRNSRSYRDGMDMVLCAFSKSSNMLQFSCANRPLILIRNGEVTKFVPDKHTIGGAIDNIAKDFSNHEIETKKGDVIYIFSDGYADQFGGKKGKTFKYKQLEEVLLANHHLPMNEQKKIIEKAYNDWKGSLDQIDDVCIIGVRL